MITGIIIGLVVGGLVGALMASMAALAGKKPACVTCHGSRVTVYAGSTAAADEGYCELRACPTCSTGERLGRSDVPMIKQSDLLP